MTRPIRLKGPEPLRHVDPLVRELWRATPEYITAAPGVTDRTIARWFAGERAPTIAHLRAALMALNLEITISSKGEPR